MTKASKIPYILNHHFHPSGTVTKQICLFSANIDSSLQHDFGVAVLHCGKIQVFQIAFVVPIQISVISVLHESQALKFKLILPPLS